ncbi:MAG: pyruvate dehydrogenase complex dihydrolipoamide acetyltransferase [Rickettsiaceae bacterium]|nr:pyruvate dehydrogenase complex dihydrolipoamide acetyltransferase [Rickettsiaceae bacterium]
MPIKILMPALSPTMEHGNLAKWLKKEGDEVKAGEVIAEIETDKATMEVEAVDEGRLAKILVKEGTNDVPVNSLIAVLIEEGKNTEDIEAFIKANITANTIIKDEKEVPRDNIEVIQDIKPTTATAKTEQILPTPQKEHNTRIFASPLARRIAEQKNLDLTQIKGTGPHGRIIKADVISLKETTNNKEQIIRNDIVYNVTPHSNMRKIIAKRLLQSKQEIPHFYLSIDCEMDTMLAVRKQINNQFGNDNATKISINDLLILAAAKSLKASPKINSSWQTEGILTYNNIDISVAVATDTGLFTPIIQNADQKNIFEISTEMRYLADKARKNLLKPEEYQGGSFSISNLGMYGIKNFNAIINPPQSCILAIGGSEKKPVIIEDKIEVRTMINLSLSCDHRVVDGIEGAKFLSILKQFIESPILLFID